MTAVTVAEAQQGSAVLFRHQMAIDQKREGQVLTRLLIAPYCLSPAVQEELRNGERQSAGGKVGCSPGTMAGMRARPSLLRCAHRLASHSSQCPTARHSGPNKLPAIPSMPFYSNVPCSSPIPIKLLLTVSFLFMLICLE